VEREPARTPPDVAVVLLRVRGPRARRSRVRNQESRLDELREREVRDGHPHEQQKECERQRREAEL
jgi:hypothetical protein